MADIKAAYGASSAVTITLAGLAASGTLTAGRASTAVVNTTTLALDYALAGRITTGTGPASGTIEVWAYAALNDTPDYPEGITGTDAAITLSSVQGKLSALSRITIITTDTTANRSYWFSATSVSALFGGVMPKRWGVIVINNTSVALNATANLHGVFATPCWANST